MDSQRKTDARIKVMFVSVLMVISIAFIALYIYATYISPTARETIPQAILMILAHSALAILIGLNMIHFSAKTKKRYPNLARVLPVGFVIASISVYLFCILLLGYRLTPQATLLYSLISLLAWSLLNIIVHQSLKKD
jgi:hypothetical protein